MSKYTRKSISTLAMVALFPIAASAAPLDDLAASKTHGAYGPSLKITHVHATEFHSHIDGSGLGLSGDVDYYDIPYRRQAVAGPWFDAPITLPGGALLCYLGMFAYDNNSLGSHIRAELRLSKGGFQAIGSIPQTPPVTVGSGGDMVYSTGIGYELAAVDVGGASGAGSPNCITIHNNILHGGNQYTIRLTMPNLPNDASDGAVKLRSVELGWYRQISPAPVSATFSDVPTNHTFFQAIEALVKSGITNGCSGGNFCPGQTVNRGQMAAFLARALGL